MTLRLWRIKAARRPEGGIVFLDSVRFQGLHPTSGGGARYSRQPGLRDGGQGGLQRPRKD